MFKSTSPPIQYFQFVERFWYSKSRYNQGVTISEYYPSGNTCLLFEFSAKKSRAFLFGPTTQKSYIRTNNECEYLSAIFFPGRLNCVNGIRPKELVNQFVALKKIFDQPVDLVGEKICKATTIDKKMNIVYSVISNLRQCFYNDHSLGRHAVELIEKTSGLTQIKEIARFHEVSVRHLETLIKNKIGLTPKFFARTIRLQTILKNISLGIPDTLTDLAFSGGYADQPHFIHDFKALTGRLPTFFMKPNREDFNLTHIPNIHREPDEIHIFHQI